MREITLIAGDQLRIIEVVAGVHLDALVEAPSHVDLALLVKQRDLDTIVLGGVAVDDGNGGVHCLVEILCAQYPVNAASNMPPSQWMITGSRTCDSTRSYTLG